VAGVGGRLEANTAGGPLDIRNVQDDAVLSTNGGNINMRAMNGRVRANTNGGDIWGADLDGAVEVETLAGDIDLRDVRGAVEAVTNVGRIDVELTLKDFSRPHEVRLHALHGDIRITLPARLPADIVARVQHSSRFDSHTITSDFRLTRDEGNSVLYAEGEINGGGSLIDLRTSGGDISIRRARE
jgi:DUF4097 and DUF4098 domain-containing protein YvlB